MYENVIVVDYDGVCALWEHGFHMWMVSNGYKHFNDGCYEVHERYGISKQESSLLFTAFNESASIKRLPPVRDAIKYIRKLHEDHGYVFHCITAIPDTRDMREARLENIEALFGKTAFERVTLCDSSSNKPALLEEYEGTECFWIEDLPKNAEMGIEFGLRNLLMDHHYNRDYRATGRVQRVHNWKEIYMHITGEYEHLWYK